MSIYACIYTHIYLYYWIVRQKIVFSWRKRYGSNKTYSIVEEIIYFYYIHTYTQNLYKTKIKMYSFSTIFYYSHIILSSRKNNFPSCSPIQIRTGYTNPNEISCSSHVVFNSLPWNRRPRCLRKIYFLAKGVVRTTYVLVKKRVPKSMELCTMKYTSANGLDLPPRKYGISLRWM